MKNSIKILLGLSLALVGLQAQALTIDGSGLTGGAGGGCDLNLDPLCYYGPSGPPASNPTTADIEQAIFEQGGGTISLFEVYKENVGDGFDTGSFAGSYDTTFPNLDPNDALIKWVTGTQSLVCGDCFLLVKDGANDPNWYVFDISMWNGTDDIVLSNFWTGTGAISHITIFDGGTNIPEPGMVGLLAIGLIGVIVTRCRIKL